MRQDGKLYFYFYAKFLLSTYMHIAHICSILILTPPPLHTLLTFVLPSFLKTVIDVDINSMSENTVYMNSNIRVLTKYWVCVKKEDEKKTISHFSFILYVFDMSFDNSFTIQQDKNWLVTCHISGCWCGFLVEFMLNYVFDDIWIIKYTYRHLNSIWNTTKHIILFSSVYIEHSNIDFFDKHTINLLIFATTLFCDLKEINRSIFHKI